jgi:hypothetical protein
MGVQQGECHDMISAPILRQIIGLRPRVKGMIAKPLTDCATDPRAFPAKIEPPEIR